MGKYLAAYGLTFLVFLVVDIIYLGFIAKVLYSRHIGFLMADKVIWPAAILFYLLFVLAVYYLCDIRFNQFSHP